MLASLSDLYMVDLLCDPELQPFNARYGMQSATGMMARRPEQQSGVPVRHESTGGGAAPP